MKTHPSSAWTTKQSGVNQETRWFMTACTSIRIFAEGLVHVVGENFILQEHPQLHRDDHILDTYPDSRSTVREGLHNTTG